MTDSAVFKSRGKEVVREVARDSFIMLFMVPFIVEFGFVGFLFFLIPLTIVSYFHSYYLGVVRVTPEQLVRVRLFGRKTVPAADVVSTDVGTSSRRGWGYTRIKYYHPVLTLVNGKRIALPLKTKALLRTQGEISRIRQLLQVPDEGTVVMPSRSVLVRLLKNKKGTHTVIHKEGPAEKARKEMYGEFTPLPGLEKHYQGN